MFTRLLYQTKVTGFLFTALLWNAVFFLTTPICFGDDFSTTTGSREQIKILFDVNEVAIYHFGEALDKPYFHPLWTPDRRIVSFDAPADHIHHRGLCLGWPDISGTDFWAEVWSPLGHRGKIISRNVETNQRSDGKIVLHESNEWQTEDGTVLLSSVQDWVFHPPQGTLQIVDVDVIFTAKQPEVVFGSDPGYPREYHGLTLRIGPFTEPRYFNSSGIEGGQNCKGKPAKWCALSGQQNGHPVLAAILDSPNNSSFPTKFYIQDQGMQFISSSPNFGKAKVLKNGETWRLQYRVIAAGKPMETEEWDVETLWKDYANQIQSQNNTSSNK